MGLNALLLEGGAEAWEAAVLSEDVSWPGWTVQAPTVPNTAGDTAQDQIAAVLEDAYEAAADGVRPVGDTVGDTVALVPAPEALVDAPTEPVQDTSAMDEDGTTEVLLADVQPASPGGDVPAAENTEPNEVPAEAVPEAPAVAVAVAPALAPSMSEYQSRVRSWMTGASEELPAYISIPGTEQLPSEAATVQATGGGGGGCG